MTPVFVRKEFFRAPAAEPPRDSRIALHVVFDGLRGTGALLDAADRLARGLNARLTVLVPQVVPYPLPLEEPPVAIDFTERSLSSLAEHVEVLLCRDRCQALLRALPPESVVVMKKARWWQREENRIGRSLRRNGHKILWLTQP